MIATPRRSGWLAGVLLTSLVAAGPGRAEPKTVHVALQAVAAGAVFSDTVSIEGLRIGATVEETERAIRALDHTATIKRTLHTATLAVDGTTVVSEPYVSVIEAMSEPLDKEHGAVEVVVNFSLPTIGTRATAIFLNRDKHIEPVQRSDFLKSMLAQFGKPSQDDSYPVEGGDAYLRGGVGLAWRYAGDKLVPCPAHGAPCAAVQEDVEIGKLGEYERRIKAGETLVISVQGYVQRKSAAVAADPTVLRSTSVNIESVELEALSAREAVKQMQAAAHQAGR